MDQRRMDTLMKSPAGRRAILRAYVRAKEDEHISQVHTKTEKKSFWKRLFKK